MTTVKELTLFFERQGLGHWAPHIGEYRLPEDAPEAGFHVAAIMPPLSVQREDTALLLDTMTRPLDGLAPDQQYGGFWVQSVEALANCQIVGRPEDVSYAVWLMEGPFPEETTNQTCTKLIRTFDKREWTGLTVHEFLVIQRLKALQHGDHRWSAYVAEGGHPAGHQWLPNARNGKKVFQGYWVKKSGQLQIAACATGSRKASRGAHPCRVTVHTR